MTPTGRVDTPAVRCEKNRDARGKNRDLGVGAMTSSAEGGWLKALAEGFARSTPEPASGVELTPRRLQLAPALSPNLSRARREEGGGRRGGRIRVARRTSRRAGPPTRPRGTTNEPFGPLCAANLQARLFCWGETARRRDGLGENPLAARPKRPGGESLCGQAEERKGRLSFFHRIDQARAFAGFADPLPNPGQGVEFVSADASSRLR